jgi:hypothetical protein
LKWQTIAEELKQNPSGFVAHFSVAFGVVILAVFWWGTGPPHWRYVLAGCGLLGIGWEVGGYYKRGRKWKPSALGMVSFWLGAIAATAAIIWRP